jgi:hypothetical protein
MKIMPVPSSPYPADRNTSLEYIASLLRRGYTLRLEPRLQIFHIPIIIVILGHPDEKQPYAGKKKNYPETIPTTKPL